VKNQLKRISNEEKLEVISQKVNRLLSYAVMLDLFMTAYESVIMLMELWKVRGQDLKCCVVSLPQSRQNELYRKLWT
jgi:hypothetical protein